MFIPHPVNSSVTTTHSLTHVSQAQPRAAKCVYFKCLKVSDLLIEMHEDLVMAALWEKNLPHGIKKGAL